MMKKEKEVLQEEEIDTPRRQEKETTTAEDMAIVERKEKGILKVRRRRVFDATMSLLACILRQRLACLSLHHVHYLAICCSATTA